MSQSADTPQSSRPADAFELWRQIYETNERAWNAVLERTTGVVGFFGASSMERLPTETAMTENMRRFKAQRRA